MRVLFATAELAPVVSVGGLGAAAAGLVGELRRQGVAVDVVLPDYGGYPLEHQATVELDVPVWAAPASVRHGTHPQVGDLHLVSVPGIERPHPYLAPDGSGWLDNEERFFAFSAAVASLWQRTGHDVVHLNDWHTATALAHLHRRPPTVLSVHNLDFQGVTGSAWLAQLGPGAAAYEHRGDTNALAGAIALADAVVAVSPHYASEIVQPEHGRGLDALLQSRGAALHGILNGIDTAVWDPGADPLLPAAYGVRDLGGRGVCRAGLLDRFGWPDDGAPLASMVTRLTPQKGVDLVTPLVPYLDRLPARLAVLGSGEAHLAGLLRDAAARHPDRVAFVEGYDEALSHQLFAGADLYLMPSRFEPCGLTQMQAMRYGALPVVTAVGGLCDTVCDADVDRAGGTGWVAPVPDPLAVLDALHRAVRGWRNLPRRRAVQRRGMSRDWSWRGPAEQYRALYEALAPGRRGGSARWSS